MYIINYMIFVLGVQLRKICIYIWKTTSFTPLHREQRGVASRTINSYNRPTPTGLVHAYQ